MKKEQFLQAIIALTLLAITQNSRATESVRVYLPETPELSIINDRLSTLENDQGQFRTDFLCSFPPTRKLAVKIAVYRDGKLDSDDSALFHLYGVPNSKGNPENDNASFFTLSRQFPQPSAQSPRNGVKENSWGVSMPGYSYGFRERTSTSSDSVGNYQQGSNFAETTELRRGKVIMNVTNGKFRLNVWVQTVPRLKSEPRYGIKRFTLK